MLPSYNLLLFTLPLSLFYSYATVVKMFSLNETGFLLVQQDKQLLRLRTFYLVNLEVRKIVS